MQEDRKIDGKERERDGEAEDKGLGEVGGQNYTCPEENSIRGHFDAPSIWMDRWTR